MPKTPCTELAADLACPRAHSEATKPVSVTIPLDGYSSIHGQRNPDVVQQQRRAAPCLSAVTSTVGQLWTVAVKPVPRLRGTLR